MGKNYYPTLFEVVAVQENKEQVSVSGQGEGSLEVPTAGTPLSREAAEPFAVAAPPMEAMRSTGMSQGLSLSGMDVGAAASFGVAAPSVQTTHNSGVDQVSALLGMGALLTGEATTEVAPQHTIDFMCAADILQATPKMKRKFEGILMRCDSAPRSVQFPMSASQKKT